MQKRSTGFAPKATSTFGGVYRKGDHNQVSSHQQQTQPKQYHQKPRFEPLVSKLGSATSKNSGQRSHAPNYLPAARSVTPSTNSILNNPTIRVEEEVPILSPGSKDPPGSTIKMSTLPSATKPKFTLVYSLAGVLQTLEDYLPNPFGFIFADPELLGFAISGLMASDTIKFCSPIQNASGVISMIQDFAASQKVKLDANSWPQILQSLLALNDHATHSNTQDWEYPDVGNNPELIEDWMQMTDDHSNGEWKSTPDEDVSTITRRVTSPVELESADDKPCQTEDAGLTVLDNVAKRNALPSQMDSEHYNVQRYLFLTHSPNSFRPSAEHAEQHRQFTNYYHDSVIDPSLLLSRQDKPRPCPPLLVTSTEDLADLTLWPSEVTGNTLSVYDGDKILGSFQCIFVDKLKDQLEAAKREKDTQHIIARVLATEPVFYSSYEAAVWLATNELSDGIYNKLNTRCVYGIDKVWAQQHPYGLTLIALLMDNPWCVNRVNFGMTARVATLSNVRKRPDYFWNWMKQQNNDEWMRKLYFNLDLPLSSRNDVDQECSPSALRQLFASHSGCMSSITPEMMEYYQFTSEHVQEKAEQKKIMEQRLENTIKRAVDAKTTALMDEKEHAANQLMKSKSECQNLQHKIDTMSGQIRKLTADLTTMKSAAEISATQISALSDEKANLRQQVKKLESQIMELRDAHSQIKTSEQVANDTRRTISDDIRTIKQELRGTGHLARVTDVSASSKLIKKPLPRPTIESKPTYPHVVPGMSAPPKLQRQNKVTRSPPPLPTDDTDQFFSKF